MNTTLGVTVIFPMAGKGERFGHKFKPFLKVGDTTFIQRAINSFDKSLYHIKEVVFIFLEEQERLYHVTEILKEMFPTLPHRCITLEYQTNGPAETVKKALQKDGKILGKIIICDCDHYLDTEPIFNYIEEGNQDPCIIPLWNLRGENIKAWSVAALSDEGYVEDIAEKEIPKSPGSFFGVIGCYYFNQIEDIILNDKLYISQIIKDLIKKGKKIKGVRISNAEFFGDPQRLKDLLDTRKKIKGTIFCDLDGTLIEHEDIPSYEAPLKVLPGTIEKLKNWRDEGYSLILTTSRKLENEKELIEALKTANISYDRLIMEIPSGPRYLINDRKPSAILTPHAIAFEIERNKGINELEIDSTKPNILKMFKGGSLSKTLLIEKMGKLFVRKVISKDKSMAQKYAKLKKQFNDMKRLSNLCKELFPALYEEVENSFEYYYDMEFLADYDLLSNYSNAEKIKASKILLKQMHEKVYKPQAHIYISGDEWLKSHFIEKIYSKIKEEKLPSNLYSLTRGERIIIDGKQYSGLSHLLKKSLEPPYINVLQLVYLNQMHGDLTFENILYKNSGYNLSTNSYEPSIKLIDTDSIDFLDPPELDLGKICQSVISQYELWSSSKEVLVKINDAKDINLNFKPDHELLNNLKEYLSLWKGIIEGDDKHIEIKGRFYMGLHLIRMIPFRLAVSKDQALFALALAIKEMSSVLDMIKNLNGYKSENHVHILTNKQE